VAERGEAEEEDRKRERERERNGKIASRCRRDAAEEDAACRWRKTQAIVTMAAWTRPLSLSHLPPLLPPASLAAGIFPYTYEHLFSSAVLFISGPFRGAGTLAQSVVAAFIGHYREFDRHRDPVMDTRRSRAPSSCTVLLGE